jgi:protein SCO1
MRTILLAVTAATLLAGCGSSAASDAAPATTANQTFAGGGLTPPRPAPAITLRDSRTGARVTLAGQRGRFTLVTFLYVHCPDVCPLIAQNLNAALRALPKQQRAQVRVLAVSVDPKGDTPTAVRAFVAQHELLPEFRYLLGIKAQLRATWAAWHVLAVQQSPDLVDHVAYTALVDRSGKERVLYGAQVQAHQVLHDLRVLMHTAKA